MKKRFISILLVLVLVLGFSVNCYAATDSFELKSYVTECCWVRNLDKSPLTTVEAISGNYTLEVDYLCYTEALTMAAFAEDYSLYDTVKGYIEDGAVGSATAAVCTALKLKSIPTAIVTALVAISYDYISNMVKENFQNVLKTMVAGNYMKVSFITTSGSLVTKSFAKYTSSNAVGVADKRGDWRLTSGYLYAY